MVGIRGPNGGAPPKVFLMRTLIMLLGVAACTPSEPRAEAKTRPPLRGLVTAEITETAFRPSLTYLGVVHAAQDASLGVVLGGRIKRLDVQIGDRVTKGAELLRLEDGEARAATGSAAAVLAQAKARLGGVTEVDETPDVRAAKVALESARDGRARLAALVSRGSVSEQDFERATAQERSAEAQLDAARAAARAIVAGVDQARAGHTQAGVALSELTVRAPFDGVIVERAARVGETVAAGAVLVRVIDDSSYRLEFDVPSHETALVAVGARVSVDGLRAGAGGSSVGTVVRLSAALQNDSRLRRAEATLEARSADALAGSRVRVRVETGASVSHPVVPCDALRSSAGIDRIWIAKASMLEERLVVVLAREAGGAGEVCLVESGAKAGERVVRNPPIGLQDGDRVAP